MIFHQQMDLIAYILISIKIKDQFAKTAIEFDFIKSKNFYRTDKNLIIKFDRGENPENNSFIDFN